MSVNDAINRLKTETKGIIEERELKERAETMTADSPDFKPENTDNPKLKRIALAYKKMDTAYWEDFFRKQNEGLAECAEESREEYIEKCVHEYFRLEAIYNSYKLIISEPHHMDEHLKKLKAKLKKLDEDYDRGRQEQMRIDGI